MGPVVRHPARGERAQQVQAAQAVCKPDHCDTSMLLHVSHPLL